MRAIGRADSVCGSMASRPWAGGAPDVVVAVQAGDFLDQVFLDLDVEAVRRRRDEEIIARVRARPGDRRAGRSARR